MNGEFDPAFFKDIPVVGKMTYFWFMGGAEEWNDKQQAKKKREFKKKYSIDRKKYGINKKKYRLKD